MADNVDITAGTGTTVATDNIGGVNFQRVKLTWGADGTATDASAAAPIPVVQTGALPAGSPAIGKLAANDGVDIGDVTINGPLGRAADASSVSAALSNEDAALLGALTETAPGTDTASSGLNGRLQRIAQRLTTMLTGIVLAAGTAIIGKVGIDQTTPGTTDSVSVATGQGAGAAIGATSGAAVITDANGTIQQYLRGLVKLWIAGGLGTKEIRSATPTQSSVADTASSTTLLASNSSRLGATIYNDSTVALYLKLGATASTTSFTALIAAGGYYEVPFGYTGIIDGIWASDASGSARITELAA